MRLGYSHLPPVILVLLLSSILSYGQAWSGILAPARATDWTQAGIPGGIPSASWANCTTSACSTLFGGTVTGASITAALASAPNNTVVRIPSGSYTISTAAYANRGNVVLRGAGPTQTTLTLASNNDLFFSVNGTGGLGSYPGSLGSTNWTAGYTAGTTVLTLASTSGISAGQNIVVDQHNEPWVYVNGEAGACTSGNSCGRNDSPLQFNGGDTRAEPEMVHVVSVNSGANQITISPGLIWTHDPTLAPQAFFWNNGGNIQYAGVENMHVAAAQISFAVSMPFCDYCWVKNVWVDQLSRSGVFFWWAYGDVVRDSYFSSALTGAPTQYGIEIMASTYALVENNICYNVTACLLPETDAALVAGYNYALNTVAGNAFADSSTHLAHNYLSLFEGDAMDFNQFDNTWGSSSQEAVFRSRLWGNPPNKTNYQIAQGIGAQQHYENIVASVIGDPTFHTVYECNGSNYGSVDNNFEYVLGFWDQCGDGLVSQYDTVSESSLMRWGNWDAVTYCANGGHSGAACGSTGSNGVRYCTGNGAGNPACTASETASTDPTFPGLSNPSTTFPSSFYNGVTGTFPSCGTGLSFWKNPSSGYCPAYPPIGPDVTCSTNCISNTALHAAMIPAQLCYANSAKDGNGFLTAFDANACYANDPASDPALQPPTGLQAVVN